MAVKAQDPTQKYIEGEMKAGKTPAQITEALVANGWQVSAAQAAVNQSSGVPPPPAPMAPVNSTNQTGGVGTPLQVENVQYNMAVSTVESRVGFFLKLASLGLWLLVFFIATTLATFVERLDDSSVEIAEILVFTIALSVAALPLFIIANMKMEQELEKNTALVDDLFYKKATRTGLYVGVVFASIATIAGVYNLLGSAFLDNSGSVSGFFQALAFAVCFGAATAYFWRLHGRTNR